MVLAADSISIAVATEGFAANRVLPKNNTAACGHYTSSLFTACCIPMVMLKFTKDRQTNLWHL